MKLLPEGTETASAITKLIERSQAIQFSMAWATVNNSVYKSILKNRHKIALSTLGISHNATDPKCLVDFIGSKDMKFSIQKNGIFHPKLGISIQGQSAKDSWKTCSDICTIINANVEVLVQWRDNEKAAYPGQKAKLLIP